MASKDLFQKFASALTSLDDSYNIYCAKADNTEGRAPLPLTRSFFTKKNTRNVLDSDSPYSASINDATLCIPGGGNIIYNLPAITAGNIGLEIYISIGGAGNVTITPNGADTINAQASKVINGDGTSVILMAFSGDWRIF